MVNPVALVPAIIANLPTNAPDIIREVNPVTWFERVIEDGRRYKIAKRQLQAAMENNRQQYDLELKRLEQFEKSYIATLQNEQQSNKIKSKNVDRSIKFSTKNIKNWNSQANTILSIILKNSSDIDEKFLTALLDQHKYLNSLMAQESDKIHNSLDKENERITNNVTTAKAIMAQYRK